MVMPSNGEYTDPVSRIIDGLGVRHQGAGKLVDVGLDLLGRGALLQLFLAKLLNSLHELGVLGIDCPFLQDQRVVVLESQLVVDFVVWDVESEEALVLDPLLEIVIGIVPAHCAIALGEVGSPLLAVLDGTARV